MAHLRTSASADAGRPSRARIALGVVAACLLAATMLVPSAPASAAPSTGSASLDPAVVERLYLAYFRRPAEPAGLNHWVGAWRNGYPIDAISNDFSGAPEFRARYGTVDDAGFVRLVYRNVLDRDPDAGGDDYWTGLMAKGLTRGQLMINFSESEEFRRAFGRSTSTVPSPSEPTSPTTAPAPSPVPVPAPTGRVFHVDCAGGVDTDDGRTQETAWRSLSKANQASLGPGDGLLLRRGCTWHGQRLDARWHGSETAPVTISAYGAGARPVIKNAGFTGVRITGSHQVVAGIAVDFDVQETVVGDGGCAQPFGEYYGVNFTGGARANTLTDSVARRATVGVHLAKNSRANRVIGNTVSDNNVARSWTSNPGRDLGGWGILIVADDNVISHNVLHDNAAPCRNHGFKRMSNSIELYEGSRNRIHHNQAFGDRVFSEMGSSPEVIATDNLYAYNLHVSAEPDARFLVTRGASAAFGPVNGTRVLHNTIHLSGPASEGIVCGGGCDGTVLVVDSNVVWAEHKAIYTDRPIPNARNVWWSSDGAPVLQMPSGSLDLATSVIADPRFVAPGSGDHRPAVGSAARGRGIGFPSIGTTDLLGVTVGVRRDAGAFQGD